MNSPPSHVDLDARILLVEQRLIARQHKLCRGAASLSGQLHQALSPKRLLLPAAGALLGVAALLSLLRRPLRLPAMPAGSARPAGMPVEIPWVRMLGLAWPMLPARWRNRVSPATASSLVTLGLPLVERLLGTRRAQPLVTMADVDLMRLSGRWFLVGELPGPLQAETLQPPELGLLPRDDGQLDLLQRRIDASGTHGSEARLQPVPGSQGARLRLSRWPEALQWLDWAWTDQAVLHVDEAYDEALIGSPERDSLWLLSRRPELAQERRQALVQIALDRGFAVDKLRFFSTAG
jgi:apolipoprotein D and lipocalin family protein